MNANHVITQMQEINSKVMAFLELDVTEKEVEDIKTMLNGIDGVSNVEYFTQEESTQKALEMGDVYTYGIEEEDLNTMFPPFFKITFETVDAEREVVNTLESTPGVGKGESDISVTESAEESIKMAESVEIIAVLAMILIIELSVFLMINTTKLMLYARRKEISIMKYVGAKDAFVKMPFAIEGVITALIAVLVVIIIVTLVYSPVVETISQKSRYTFLNIKEVMPNLRLILVIIGILIGAFGSTLSMNKYLDV